MKRYQYRFLSILCAFALLMGLWTAPAMAEDAAATDLTVVEDLYKKADVNTDLTGAVAVTLSADGTVSADSMNGLSVDGSVLRITQAGSWLLSGSWNGRIEVEADENEKVHLFLDGLSIVSSEGPAIYEISSDKLIITLVAGSENSLTDATALTVEADEIAAALYAADDLSINGTGDLTVSGTVKHGIVSHKDLVIAGGSITVTAESDAIRGRNSVLVLDGNLVITAQGDGIVSTRENKEGKGYVVIAGGNITLNCGGGAGEAAQQAGTGFGWGRGWDDWNRSAASSDTASAKGIKAATDLVVLDGNLVIDSLDDALHAVNVTVKGGSVTIKTGDDGIHADVTLTIDGGTIDIQQSYEGLEGQYINIGGGDIALIASDDGVNAADGSSTANSFFQAQDAALTITGGRLYVNADGDGLDSNGSIVMSGGYVEVCGPTNSGNAAVDYDGSFSLTGGTLIATGATGMMQNVTSAQNQAVVLATTSQSAGTAVTLKDGDGNTLLSVTPAKAYQCVLVSTAEMQVGSSYTITCGETTVYSDTITTNVVGGGNGGFGGFGVGRGGRGGWDWNNQQTPQGGTTDGAFDPSQMTPPDGGDMTPPDGTMDPSAIPPTAPDGQQMMPGQQGGWPGGGRNGGGRR